MLARADSPGGDINTMANLPGNVRLRDQQAALDGMGDQANGKSKSGRPQRVVSFMRVPRLGLGLACEVC
jgi:hypothetical protein